MGRFIEGEDRGQLALLPTSLDEYVGVDNPVRVVDGGRIASLRMLPEN
jgi:hypothetical protein